MFATGDFPCELNMTGVSASLQCNDISVSLIRDSRKNAMAVTLKQVELLSEYHPHHSFGNNSSLSQIMIQERM